MNKVWSNDDGDHIYIGNTNICFFLTKNMENNSFVTIMYDLLETTSEMPFEIIIPYQESQSI